MGLGDFLSGVQSVIETGIQTLPAIISAGQQGTVQQLAPGVASGGGSDLQALLMGAGAGQLGANGGGGGGVACAPGTSAFRATRSSARAVREIRAVNPVTGKIESWTHRGSPIIWSGDRAIAKKYAKSAGFTLRRRGSCPTRRRTTRRR